MWFPAKELCLALYSQNVLAYDEAEVNRLRASGDDYAFEFLITKSEILRYNAQLAPIQCTASCVTMSNRELWLVIPGYDKLDFDRNILPAQCRSVAAAAKQRSRR